MKNINELVLKERDALLALSEANLITFNLLDKNILNSLSLDVLDLMIKSESKRDSFAFEAIKGKVENLILNQECKNSALLEYFKDDLIWWKLELKFNLKGKQFPQEYKKYIPSLKFSRDELRLKLLDSNVSEDFILNNIELIDYYELFNFMKIEILSHKTISKYFDKFDAERLSKHPNLPEPILDEFRDELYWYRLAEYWEGWNDSNLIEKYYDELQYQKDTLSLNHSISNETISKYKELFNFDTKFCDNHNDDTIIEFIDNIPMNALYRSKNNRNESSEFSKKLSNFILDKYSKCLDFLKEKGLNEDDLNDKGEIEMLRHVAFYYPCVNKETIEEFHHCCCEEYDYDYDLQNFKYSLEEHIEFGKYLKFSILKLKWSLGEETSYTLRFDDEMLEKYGDKLNWNYIAKINCSNEFFENNFNKFNLALLDNKSYSKLSKDNILRVLEQYNKEAYKTIRHGIVFKIKDEKYEKIKEMYNKLEKYFEENIKSECIPF